MRFTDKLRKPAARSGNTCVLRLPPGWPESGGEIDWLLLSAQGQRLEGRAASFAQLPAAARAATLQVWSAAADSLLTHVKLPSTSRAKILQALPFALEEQLAVEPEQLQFTVAGDSASNGQAVAVTAKEQLTLWQVALAQADLSPRTLCPITLATPWEKNCWTLAWDRHEAWLRTGEYSGLCCSGEWPATRRIVELALAEARVQQRAPEKLILLRPPERIDTRALETELGVPVRISQDEIFSASAPAAPFNLLNGGSVSAEDQTRKVARIFAPALICFGLWLAVILIADTMEWVHLRTVDSAQRSDMLALFRSTFPDAKTVVDPALQMERNLAQLAIARGPGQSSDLLNLLGHAAPALTPLSKLTALRYDGTQLQIDAEFTDQDGLESARAALAIGGLKVEILDSSARDGKLSARLRVSGSGKT